jgi:hypothetical protein
MTRVARGRYIRKARNTIDNAVQARVLSMADLSCSMALKVKLSDALDDDHTRGRTEALCAAMSPQEEEDSLVWHLQPFRDIRYAAIMFNYANLDQTPLQSSPGHEGGHMPMRSNRRKTRRF